MERPAEVGTNRCLDVGVRSRRPWERVQLPVEDLAAPRGWQGVQIGAMETMDPKATDFSAQLAKIKAAGGDTVFVTTAVEQITLILRQAKEQQLTARIIDLDRRLNQHGYPRFDLSPAEIVMVEESTKYGYGAV